MVMRATDPRQPSLLRPRVVLPLNPLTLLLVWLSRFVHFSKR